MILENHKVEIVVLIEEAHDNGARYLKACEVVGISLRTLQRWKREGLKDMRKGSQKRVVRKLSPERRAEVLSVCNSEKYRDSTPHEIVPMLLDEGRYVASVRTMYRVLKEEKMLHLRNGSKRRKKRSKPPERRASQPNTVWCWDITWMPSHVKGIFYYAYVIIDIFDRFIVGWTVHEEESEEHSKDLFENLSRGRNIAFEYLHADNGSPMRGTTLVTFLKSIEVQASFNRPRTSNDNPFIESFFKTMKYTPGYPLKFRDMSHAREWMTDFVNWYNTQHLHSSIGFVTPSQMRNGEAQEIFRKRNEVIKQAKKENPECWGSRETIQWKPVDEVVLNPEKRE
ncbi:MAG: IS3 family transposase [bacterium]